MSKTLSLEDIMRIKSIGDLQVSPDGHHVCFTVPKAVMTEKKSEYLTHIYVADADGSNMIQSTFGDSSCTQPRWSPDGKWIAFTSSRSEKNNLYLIPGTGGEPQQLTTVQTEIANFKWSPDGKWIAFVMPDPPTPSEEQAEEEKNDARVVDENVKLNRLWLAPVEIHASEKHETRLLTTGDFNIGSCFGRSNFDWSADGKEIVFTHTPTPRTDDWSLADISITDVDTGQLQPLVRTGAADSPLYSPDGCWVAYLATDDSSSWSSTFDVFVIPTAGGPPRLLAQTFERWAELVGWSADSQQVYFTDTRGTATGLFVVSLDGSAPRRLDRGNLVLSSVSLNPSNSMFSFVAQTTICPPEVYVTSPDRFMPVQISRVNVPAPDCPLTELIRYKSSDDVEIEGLLTYPVGYKRGKQYPLLLIIHGGPMGMFTQTFTAKLDTDDPYPIAIFASQDYAVLRCNIRGSSGYGQKFLQANYRDWGGMDYEDLMKGVDAVIDMGIADSTRLGVMGWSYGGYLTAWTLTQTKRFKAASVGAAPVNLISAVGTTDIPTCITDYFGTAFWDDLDIYFARSPIFHVKNVSTPTLIQHFEEDDIVPLSQGNELYRALKQQGIPVKMAIYPRTPHGLQEPKLLLDYAKRNVAWFNQYLKQ